MTLGAELVNIMTMAKVSPCRITLIPWAGPGLAVADIVAVNMSLYVSVVFRLHIRKVRP